MANWQRELNLTPEWGQARAGALTVASMAGIVAARLGQLKPFAGYVEEQRKELEEEFRDASTDAALEADEFDELMRQLYDWGDRSLDGRWNGKRVCWVRTF